MASLNGTHLEPNPDTSEPYPNSYPPMPGTPQTLRAWTVPASSLQDGPSPVQTTMTHGKAADIVFLDVAVPCRPAGP